MILASLTAVAYRAHTPRWAHAPTSGAGAAAYGGRANRVGVPALYLALDEHTALAEYKQQSELMPPATLVSYNIDINPVVDFRGGVGTRFDAIWEDFFCDWRNLWFDLGIEPPSWIIGDLVIEAKAKGILFNSTLTGKSNLVIYTETLEANDKVTVYDPRGDLPTIATSWS
jgi:RES domain-containing protein